MIRRSNHYFSVNRTLWHHIKFNAVYESRNQQANENDRYIAAQAEQQLAKTTEKETVLMDA